MSSRALTSFSSMLIQNVASVSRAAQARASSVAVLKDVMEQEMTAMRDAGLLKLERVITSRQDSSITVYGRKDNILNFCANNYLGLASHPEIVKAGQEAYSSRGAGLSSVRVICGTQDIHKELERKIAEFHNKDDAILYASCFDANGGLFEAILSEEDVVISDELNHASIIDGIRLCKAGRFRYKHVDMEDLELKLKHTQSARMRLICSDGAFSMDGTVLPLQQIVDLAEKYEALVFVDECHATGIFGRTGRGVEDYFNLKGRVHIINSTLGKALGGASGGYTTGPKAVVDILRNKSRPYVFSNSLPPPVVAAAIKVMDIIMESTEMIEKLLSNTKHFRKRMREAGFVVTGHPEHPICPVMLGDEIRSGKIAEELLDRGIYVISFAYPVVARGKARIRVQISAVHSTEEIDKCVDMFTEVGRKYQIVN